MDFKHVGWAVTVPLVLPSTTGVSATTELSTATGDVAIDVPGTYRQAGQNNSTGLSEPNPTVIIDNRTITDGDTTTTDDNPILTTRVGGSASIGLLVVRVDGDSKRIYTPNSIAVNETATPDVNAGEHTLEVLVQSSGRTIAYRATIIEDSIAPAIVSSLPFRTGSTSIYDRPENNYMINRLQIQLDGTLHDHSDVEQAAIELRYHGQGINTPWGFRKRIVINDPNTSISKSLRLGSFNEQVGAGQNSLKIMALDPHGHRRHYNASFYVEDENPPLIEIFDQRLINMHSAIRLTIWVTDQVGIRSVDIRRGSTDGPGSNYEIQPKLVGARPIEHTLTKTTPLAGDNRNITAVADDGAENTAKREIEVGHMQLIRPAIEVRPDTLRVSDNRVHVEGRVYDGRVTSVYAETVGPTGNTTDPAQIYGGDATSAATFNETLQLDSCPARIRTRVTDSTGREHIEPVQVAQSNVMADLETVSTTSPGNTVRTNTPLPGIPPEPSSQGPLGTLIEAIRNLVSTTATGEFFEV